jgi:hypothetical protein
MITGHTKFDCDRGFGSIKKKYSVSNCETILDIEKIINTSSGKNYAQVTRDPKTKEILVPFFKWTQFLDKFFIKIDMITNFHHFKFCSDFKGFVEMREFCDSEISTKNLLKKKLNLDFFPNNLRPEVLIPNELPLSRQYYLYKNIRSFCSNDFKADLTAPKPNNYNLNLGKVDVKLKRKANSVKFKKKQKI